MTCVHRALHEMCSELVVGRVETALSTRSPAGTDTARCVRPWRDGANIACPTWRNHLKLALGSENNALLLRHATAGRFFFMHDAWPKHQDLLSQFPKRFGGLAGWSSAENSGRYNPAAHRCDYGYNAATTFFGRARVFSLAHARVQT